MKDGWLSLDEFLKRYEHDAAQWMSDRDERLRTSTDVETGDGRRRSEPEPKTEDDP